jgi:hypothetical protein
MTSRPTMLFPCGVHVTPAGVITAPVAVLILAADDDEGDAPVDATPARPGLVKALPSNVVALPARRVA